MDNLIQNNTKILENENYVGSMIMRFVIEQFKNKQNLPMDLESSKRVNAMVVKEYMNEFYGRVA